MRTFQSTRPSRASTVAAPSCHLYILISIHKALTGLDTSLIILFAFHLYFNPQGPHGPRPWYSPTQTFCWIFQSTRPSRASTRHVYVRLCGNVISIHKALTGLDCFACLFSLLFCHFNPQGPHGPRLISPPIIIEIPAFQSTRPSRASTVCGG